MNMNNTQYLIEGTYFKPENIPNRGICLVPIKVKEQVTVTDIINGRCYRNSRGNIIKLTWTVDPEGRSFCGAISTNGFLFLKATRTAEELAVYINSVNKAYNSYFESWV